MKKKTLVALTLFITSVLLFATGIFLAITYGDTFKTEEYSLTLILTIVSFVLAVILLGVIFVIFLISLSKAAYPEKKASLDERQILINGKGAEYGLTAIAFFAFAMWILEAFELPQFAQPNALLVLAVLLGFLVYGVYRIWHGAYFAVNGNSKAITALLGVYTVISLVGGINDIIDGKLVEDGLLTTQCGVTAAGIMCLSFLVTIGLKALKDRKDEDA